MGAVAMAVPEPATEAMTGEEFFKLYSHRRAELVDGVVVEEEMPSLRHGQVCMKIGRYLANFVEERDLGQAFSNDSLIRVKKTPDTVRGPDICFVSYDSLPKGPAPEGISDLVPELVVEVRSPSNTWPKILAKVAEYLTHGIATIVVLDPDGMTASVFRESGHQIFYAGQELTVPDVLPGFAIPISKLFD